MKFRLLTVGKTNKSYFIETEQEYSKRLAKYIIFEKIELPDVRNAKNLSPDQIKKEEGKLILSKLEKSGLVVLLDEGGKEMSSPQFSVWIRDEMNRGHKIPNLHKLV